jgi:hypothetical protein
MAAMASKTGKLGFVGGMDIPLIRKFQCGYEQGAQVRQPEGRDLPQHDRHHAAAWNDPTRGGELAKAQFARAPTSSSRRPAAPARCLQAGQGCRQAGDRRRQQPEPPHPARC